MELLTVKEVAALKGCSERYIKKLALDNVLEHIDGVNTNGKKKYYIPLHALEPQLQKKWYVQQGIVPPAPVEKTKKPAAQKVLRPLDFYSKDQREEINRWVSLLERWQAYRRSFAGSAAQADAAFIEEESLTVSAKTLYRRWAACQARDWDGLVDNRGKRNKGKSVTPQEIRDLFEYFYLDEHAINVKKCYELTESFLKLEQPELLPRLPSYATAYRWAKEMPLPLACLAREGNKAFDDNYGLYVDRLYDDMASNDYWIADGHRVDVITKSEDGKERNHRMALTAFIDARSGIYVGWVLTENFSSDATLLALRKAIRRHGIPHYLYVDNGREYLNHDIGGMGHRTRKRKIELKLPTPILSRLGITMVNALPRNARAKLIEREFQNMTFLASLFDTYCGSNVVVKPEKLKYILKDGRIPTDSELYGVLECMIEGYFNCQEYGGKVAVDRGRTKIEVYHEHLPRAVRKAAEEDLNLMMMRSSQLQTVSRNGVYVLIGGEKIFYSDDALLLMQGKKVFVRHDPEHMQEVRIYDENEAFIKTAPLRADLMLAYGDTKEKTSAAMAAERRWKRKVKDGVTAIREKSIAQFGEVNALDILMRVSKINREGLLVPSPDVIELVRPEEIRHQLAATGTDGIVKIDRSRMIKNNEAEER